MGQVEQESVSIYNPSKQTISTFVRDPRINWVDTCKAMHLFCHGIPALTTQTVSVGTDGYLYFTVNQLNFSPQTWPGTDRRIHPYVLFRARLPNNATKVIPS